MKRKFFEKKDGCIRIGRLELFIGTYRVTYYFGAFRTQCDCLIVSLGPIGFTWLSNKYGCA